MKSKYKIIFSVIFVFSLITLGGNKIYAAGYTGSGEYDAPGEATYHGGEYYGPEYATGGEGSYPSSNEIPYYGGEYQGSTEYNGYSTAESGPGSYSGAGEGGGGGGGYSGSGEPVYDPADEQGGYDISDEGGSGGGPYSTAESINTNPLPPNYSGGAELNNGIYPTTYLSPIGSYGSPSAANWFGWNAGDPNPSGPPCGEWGFDNGDAAWECGGGGNGAGSGDPYDDPLNTAVAGRIIGPNSCLISLGGSSCSVSLSWNTINPPPGVTSILSSPGVAGSIVANSSGPTPFSIPYDHRSFTLINDGSLLDFLAVTSDCEPPSIWDAGTTKCVAANTAVNGVCGSKSTTYPFGSTVYPAGSTYCAAGSPSSAPPFPTVASPVKNWICSGQNGGATSPQCSAILSSLVLYPITAIKSVGGTVKSDDSRINCGNTCGPASYTQNSTVVLVATPSSAYWRFSQWGPVGDCSGINPVCSLTMNAAKTVTAVFVPRIFTIKEF